MTSSEESAKEDDKKTSEGKRTGKQANKKVKKDTDHKPLPGGRDDRDSDDRDPDSLDGVNELLDLKGGKAGPQKRPAANRGSGSSMKRPARKQDGGEDDLFGVDTMALPFAHLIEKHEEETVARRLQLLSAQKLKRS